MTVSYEDEQRFLHRAINLLREQDPVVRRRSPSWAGSWAPLWSMLIATIGFAVWRPLKTAVVLIGLCTFAYVLTMIDRVLIFTAGARIPAIVITDERPARSRTPNFRAYTILVPAYNEPEVVGRSIGGHGRLEYPADKLQVLLLLEADDEVTIDAARRTPSSDDRSPSFWCRRPNPAPSPRPATTGCTSPPARSSPSTTPRTFPSPLQLRRRLRPFATCPDDVACIQGKLDYYNARAEPADRMVHRASTACGSATSCPA